MFILIDEFKIKPWEYNDDGEVYKEDLANIIALKYMQSDAKRREQEKADIKAGLQQK
jgi:hypothetical protein